MNVLLKSVVMHGISHRELYSILKAKKKLVAVEDDESKNSIAVTGDGDDSILTRLVNELPPSDINLSRFRGDPNSTAKEAKRDVIERNNGFEMGEHFSGGTSKSSTSSDVILSYGSMLISSRTRDQNGQGRGININDRQGGLSRGRNNQQVNSTKVSVFTSVAVITVIPIMQGDRDETTVSSFYFPHTVPLDIACLSPDFPIRDMSIPERISAVQHAALAILSENKDEISKQQDVVAFLHAYYHGKDSSRPVISVESFTANVSLIIASPIENEVGVTQSYLLGNRGGRESAVDVIQIEDRGEGVTISSTSDSLSIDLLRDVPFSPADIARYVSFSDQDRSSDALVFTGAEWSGSSSRGSTAVSVLGQPISIHEDAALQRRLLQYLSGGLTNRVGKSGNLLLGTENANGILRMITGGVENHSLLPPSILGNSRRPADIKRVGWGYITKSDIALRVGNTISDTLPLKNLHGDASPYTFINDVSSDDKGVDTLISTEGFCYYDQGTTTRPQELSAMHPMMFVTTSSNTAVTLEDADATSCTASSSTPIMRAALSDQMVIGVSHNQSICVGTNLFINGRYSKQSRDIWNADIGWYGNRYSAYDPFPNNLSRLDVDWVAGAKPRAVFIGNSNSVLYAQGAEVIVKNSMFTAINWEYIGEAACAELGITEYSSPYSEEASVELLVRVLLEKGTRNTSLEMAPMYTYKYAMGTPEVDVSIKLGEPHYMDKSNIDFVRVSSMDSWRLTRKVSRFSRTSMGTPATEPLIQHIQDSSTNIKSNIGSILSMGKPIGTCDPFKAVASLQKMVNNTGNEGYTSRAIFVKYLLSDRMLIWDEVLNHLSNPTLDKASDRTTRLLLMDLAFRVMTVAFTNDFALRVGVLSNTIALDHIFRSMSNGDVNRDAYIEALGAVYPHLGIENSSSVTGLDSMFTSRRPDIFKAVMDAVSRTDAKWAVVLFRDMISELRASDMINGLANYTNVVGV